MPRANALLTKLQGMALIHQGNYVEALPNFVEAHVLNQHILGPTHVDTL